MIAFQLAGQFAIDSQSCFGYTVMDLISVSASIVGLLSVAAKVSKLMVTFMRSAKDSPQTAQNLFCEVTDISSCLRQLQSYLLGTRVATTSRTSMLMVEQIAVSLTTCVTTFSELEKTLTHLTKNQPNRVIDKIKWARKEPDISKLVVRLQSSKTSLNLMLTTLTWYDCFIVAYCKLRYLPADFSNDVVSPQMKLGNLAGSFRNLFKLF